MVAHADHSVTAVHRRSDRDWRKLGCRSFHLYVVLKGKLPVRDSRYRTILVIVTGLLVASLLFDLPVLFKVALATGVLSIVSAAVARLIERIWFALAQLLGWVNSRVILSVVFFVFLSPMAWFSRWFRGDSLNLRGRHADTIYHTRNHKYRKEDLENLW